MRTLIQTFFISFIILSSCTIPEKQASETTGADTVATNSTDTTTAEKTLPENVSIALEFINNYVKHLNSGDPFDPMSWVENNELATDEFKASYKKLVADALETDPEVGLDYDPILNAQDFPKAFDFVKIVDDEYVVVTGNDGSGFRNVIKIKFVANGWFVDGAGVVNVDEEKRGL